MLILSSSNRKDKVVESKLLCYFIFPALGTDEKLLLNLLLSLTQNSSNNWNQPDLLTKEEVGQARHMGAHLVLLVGDQDQPFCFCFSLWPDMLNCLHHEEKCQQYKDQPQHPVFPLQLRHLRQNAQSFLRKSSKANLFEENKIPSDPVPIVKLPAAKHWAHARLVVKYILKHLHN